MRFMRCSSPWLSWAGLGLVWAGLHWVGLSVLYWTVLVCAGLCRRWAGLHWAGLCWAELCCAGSCWSVLFGAGLCCARLDQAVVCVCVGKGGGARPIVRPHRSLALSSVVLVLVRSSALSLARSFSRCFALPLVLSSAGSFARFLARCSLPLLFAPLRSPPPTDISKALFNLF